MCGLVLFKHNKEGKSERNQTIAIQTALIGQRASGLDVNYSSIDVHTLTSIQMLVLMLLFRLLYRDKEGQVSKIQNTKVINIDTALQTALRGQRGSSQLPQPRFWGLHSFASCSQTWHGQVKITVLFALNIVVLYLEHLWQVSPSPPLARWFSGCDCFSSS